MKEPSPTPFIKIVDTDIQRSDFIPIAQRVHISENQTKVNHPQVVERILALFWGNRSAQWQELLKVLYINKNGDLIAVEDHAEGCIDHVEQNADAMLHTSSKLYEMFGEEISALIVAHNHPSGVNIHSSGDIEAFAHLQKTLGSRNIEARDSYILGIEGILDEMKQQEALKAAQEFLLPADKKQRGKLIAGTRSKVRRALKYRDQYYENHGVIGFNRLSRESNLCNGV